MTISTKLKPWRSLPLSEIADIERDAIAPEQIATGTAYVGLENVTSSGEFSNVGRVANGDLASTKFQFSPRHILYGKLRPYLSKIALPDFDGVCSTDILPILPRSRVNRSFLYHFLRQPQMVAFAASRSIGANLPRLSPRELATFEIPLPFPDDPARSLAEQKRIADILDKADAIRRKRQEGLLATYCLRKSLLLSFTGDAAAVHVRPELEGTGKHLPAGFTWRRLDEICPIIADIDHNMPKAVESGVPFISPKDMPDEDELDFSDVKFISAEDFGRLSRKIQPRRNDIIYSRIGARLGKAKLVKVDFPFLASYSCCTIRVNETVAHPLYIAHYLDSIITRRQANLDTQSIAVPDLGLAKIKAFLVPVSALKKQMELVAELQATEQSIARMKSGTEEADELFNSLVQRAFRGEL